MWETKMVSGSEASLEELFEFFAERLEQIFPLQVEADLFLLNVVEAVNNAVEHGHSGNDKQILNVSYCLKPNQAFVIVQDSGCGFIPHIPNVDEVVGSRGRGLGMIKNNSDAMLMNRCGNAIAFFKGGFLMDCLVNRKDALTLNNGVIILTELTPKPGINSYQTFHNIFESFKQVGRRKIFLDLRHFRILTSREWGVIFAEADNDDVTLLVLFNAGEAILETSKMLGIQRRESPYDKIKIFTELEPTIRLLEDLLRPAEKAKKVGANTP